MKKEILRILLLLVILKIVTGPPTKTKVSEDKQEDEDDYDDDIHQLSYKKYLKEVMSVLMTDESFKRKIMTEGKGLADKAKEFSSNLEFVSHGIRTRLDELKRRELDRMRNLMKLKTLLKQSIASLVNIPEFKTLTDYEKDKLLSHLDYNNVNSFEPSDLEKLIVQTTRDLEEIDKKRREAFKNYEMEKELEKRERLEKLDGEEKTEEEKRMKSLEDKHKNHPKLHHPGNEAQLLDVWEEEDGLDKRDFDPRTFFHLHDINSDGMWDQNEVEALFQKELDKVYDPNAPEDDMVERYEDMNRMREHLVTEADTDKDGVISLKEFLSYSSRQEFKKDEEWDAIDGREAFDEKELETYKVRLDKLKLESVEGITEELIVEERKIENTAMDQVQQQPQQVHQQPEEVQQQHQQVYQQVQQQPQHVPQQPPVQLDHQQPLQNDQQIEMRQDQPVNQQPNVVQQNNPSIS